MKTKRSRLWLVPFVALLVLPLSLWALNIRIPLPRTMVQEVDVTVDRMKREGEGPIQKPSLTSDPAVNSSPQSVPPFVRPFASVRPFTPKVLPDAPPVSQASPRTQPSSSSSPSAPVPFARPVPAKKGIVYTPGSEETPDSMVDVRDFAPGTLVKHPRTGVIFRVP